MIENGFYYDFARKEPFTEDDLVKIENKMKEIVDRNEKTKREVWDRDKAIKHFKEKGEIKNLKFEEFVSKNNIAISEKKVIFLGTEDLIVIDGPDGILVANKDSAAELKKYIKKTKSDI